jgi:hypothetical protein
LEEPAVPATAHPTAHAIDQFIAEHFGGDATKALLALAEQRDIGVAWIDRQVVAQECAPHKVTLTDELWDRIKIQLGGFDAYASDPGSNVHTDYIESILRELGVKNDAGEDLDL